MSKCSPKWPTTTDKSSMKWESIRTWTSEEEEQANTHTHENEKRKRWWEWKNRVRDYEMYQRNNFSLKPTLRVKYTSKELTHIITHTCISFTRWGEGSQRDTIARSVFAWASTLPPKKIECTQNQETCSSECCQAERDSQVNSCSVMFL